MQELIELAGWLQALQFLISVHHKHDVVRVQQSLDLDRAGIVYLHSMFTNIDVLLLLYQVVEEKYYLYNYKSDDWSISDLDLNLLWVILFILASRVNLII